MIWGCISAYGTSNLHTWKGTIGAWKVYTGFGIIMVSSRKCLFREGLSYFSKKMLNFILELLEPDLPGVKIFYRLITLGPSWNKKHNKEDPGLLTVIILHHTKTGTAFLSQKSSSWSPQFPEVYGLLLKEEGMHIHSGKHGAVSTALSRVSTNKYTGTVFFLKIVHFLLLNIWYVSYFPVNKIWDLYEGSFTCWR